MAVLGITRECRLCRAVVPLSTSLFSPLGLQQKWVSRLGGPRGSPPCKRRRQRQSARGIYTCDKCKRRPEKTIVDLMTSGLLCSCSGRTPCDVKIYGHDAAVSKIPGMSGYYAHACARHSFPSTECPGTRLVDVILQNTIWYGNNAYVKRTENWPIRCPDQLACYTPSKMPTTGRLGIQWNLPL